MLRAWSMSSISSNGQVKLFCPYPTRAPQGTSLFFVAPVLLSLYFFLAPPYIITKFTLFSSAPPFFITRTFSLTPRLGGDGGRTIWPAHIAAIFCGFTRCFSKREATVLHAAWWEVLRQILPNYFPRSLLYYSCIYRGAGVVIGQSFWVHFCRHVAD